MSEVIVVFCDKCNKDKSTASPANYLWDSDYRRAANLGWLIDGAKIYCLECKDKIG